MEEFEEVLLNMDICDVTVYELNSKDEVHLQLIAHKEG